MICATGASAKSRKSRPFRLPAQLSNSLTTSAPASIWADRYSTVAAVIRSIKAWNVGRSVSFSLWAAA